MSINLQLPKLTDLEPRLTVVGVGGAGCNAVNNMIAAGLSGVEFVVANTDAQALSASSAEHRIQLGINLTEGLGAGAKPEIGQAAAEEAAEEIRAQVSGSHMVFLAAGMGGGTGTGAAAVIARVAREQGILVVGVVTKPFHFEGSRRMRVAEAGIEELKGCVDTLIAIPNQNLFRIANEKTTFAEAFVLADHVLYSGVACIVDLIIKEGLINLDFADVRSVMAGMGTAMMGTGEASGERRATIAAEEAIANPLLDDISLSGAKGLLLSITGGPDLTLFEVDEAAERVRTEVEPEATIIVGATFDDSLEDKIRVSIVASGMDRTVGGATAAAEPSFATATASQPSAAIRPSHTPPPQEQDFPSETASSDQANQQRDAISEESDGSTPDSSNQSMADDAGQSQEPSVLDRARQAAAYMGGTEASADQPPPVPNADPGELQQRLSDAIQTGGRPADNETTTPAGDPSLSGVWDDGVNTPNDDQFHDPSVRTARSSNANHEPQWQGPGGVTIEEGLPPMTRSPANAFTPANAPTAGSRPAEAPSAVQFQPEAPPSDVRRPSRRMPTVEDFPAVGQREYHARAGTGANAPPQSGYGNAQQPVRQPKPNRKRGFLERLTGFGRKQSDSRNGPENAHTNNHETPSSNAPQRFDAGAKSTGREFQQEDRNTSEGVELPVFFEGRRKR